jgi:glycosyltransferase involved in cell wall biosynthesis
MKFSLVIACYKDAPHLLRNVKILDEYLSQTKFEYEFVFVEDASPDDTAKEVQNSVEWLHSMGRNTQTIYHEKNTGRGGAVTDGIQIAKGEIVGFIDIDLEHLMDGLIPMILEVSSGQADVVVGRRALGNPLAKPVRVVSSYVYRWLVHAFIPLPVADTECGLKVFNRSKILPVLETVKDKHWFWDTEIVHKAWVSGLLISERWIVFVEDKTKATTVRLWHDTWAYLIAIRNYRSNNLLLPHSKSIHKKTHGCGSTSGERV